MTAVGDELAELRRRVYGPDAAADPTDVARLRQLEDAGRASESTEEPDVEATPAEIAPPAAPPSEPRASAIVRPPLRTVLRRRRVIVGLVVVAVVAAVVTSIWLFTRTPTTLRQVGPPDLTADTPLASSLGRLDVNAGTYEQYESFERFAVVSAARSGTGVGVDLTCLMLIDTASITTTFDGLYDYSCTPEGLDPSLDVVQSFAGGAPPLGDRPAGSVARFVLRGDHVEVTVAEGRDVPEIPTPAPR